MNLAEVLAAAIVLACASSGSLQIWASTAAASRTAELRQEQLVGLDGALLEAVARLRQPLETTPGRPCAAAAEQMAQQLASLPLPDGVQRQLEVHATGVWLRLQTNGLPLRQRWLDAAALGHCAAPYPQTEAGDGRTL